ncbi:MAG: hypothetical protein OEV40_27795 [Acidimicrobiia bacterium]|nr:hypothetical protein [Acidimicrobiia bacterium]
MALHTLHRPDVAGLWPSVLDRLAARRIGGRDWNIWRGLVGLAYLATAVFNAIYTLPRSSELDGYAEGAWFGFLAEFMRDVFMPNGAAFMAAVIVFEILVGTLILTRGVAVDIGIVLSVLWVLLVLPFLAWPFPVANIVLLVLQGSVLLRRYDRFVWFGLRRG